MIFKQGNAPVYGFPARLGKKALKNHSLGVMDISKRKSFVLAEVPVLPPDDLLRRPVRLLRLHGSRSVRGFGFRSGEFHGF